MVRPDAALRDVPHRPSWARATAGRTGAVVGRLEAVAALSAIACAVAVVALEVTAVARGYSPVPFNDMWNDSALRVAPLVGTVGLVAFHLLLLRSEWQSLDHAVVDPRTQALTATALALHVHDVAQLHKTYVYDKDVERNAQWAERSGLSFFAVRPYSTLASEFGAVALATGDLPTCEGSIDRVRRIADDPSFLRIGGWVARPDSSIPQGLKVLGPDRKVVGYAVVGFDVDRPRTSRASVDRSGFDGYVAAGAVPGTLTLVTDGESPCRLVRDVP